MTGLEFRNFLYLNKISQEEAAKLVGTTRQTINNWCNKGELKGKILTDAKFIVDTISAKINGKSSKNNSGVVVSGNANTANAHIDNRQYYSDSPSVLLNQIEIFEKIINEKDLQIARLLKITEDLTSLLTSK